MLRQFQNIANDNVRNYLLESLHKVLELDLEDRKFGKVIRKHILFQLFESTAVVYRNLVLSVAICDVKHKIAHVQGSVFVNMSFSSRCIAHWVSKSVEQKLR